MNGFKLVFQCSFLLFSLLLTKPSFAGEWSIENAKDYWGINHPRVREKNGREDCAFKCKWIPAPSETHRPVREAPALELTAPTIKILSWNVYKGREAQFLTDFASLSSDKDIVMLSEVTDGPEVKPAFDRSLQFGWDFGISFYMKGDIMTGLATGSVAQPKSILVKRTQHKEPFVGSYKLILITTYHHRPTGLDIMALNIHGINQVPDREFEQQIADVAPVIAAHRGPVVFVGDFNVNSDQRMPMLKRILEPLGLRRLPWENPKTGKQLDDGFARGFEVRRARFLNQVINRSSDHPAMELELLPVAQ